MPDLNFLDRHHAIYDSHEIAWRRDERRLVGGDSILSELVQFGHEEATSFTARQAWARYLNFARVHTTILSGHLRRGAPTPNYAELGEVRTRGEQQGKPTLAELFHFNCDGVGWDGSQLPAFMDGVEQRALATGFRWLMVEMPTVLTLQAIRARLRSSTPTDGANGDAVAPAAVTDEEVRAGFRPFLVEYSPLSVTNWRYRDGVLQWAVVRIPVDPVMDFSTVQPTSTLGYYLMVRQGYTGLGADFEGGGWWKYDAQKAEIGKGAWSDTGGDIPMWLHLGEPGSGTYERPSIGTSSTMELGQISADLMNAVSEQRFNLRQAAKSINYFMGIDKDAHDSVVMQQGDGSISIGVPAAKNPDGTFQVPTLANSSAVALDATAYSTVIDAAIAEAKEIMVRQVTSTPDVSGASKEAGFAEATSPLLARIAATAEQSFNTMLYFVAKRFGVPKPTASIMLPREYELRSVLTSIDTMLETMTKAGISSPTWSRVLVTKKGDELDVLPEDSRKQIEIELGEGSDAALNRSLLQAQVVKAWLDAGGSEAGAAQEAGVTSERVAVIYGTPNPDNPAPDIAPAAPGQAA